MGKINVGVMNRGAWSAEEDLILTDYISIHGEGRWKSLPFKAGLRRCGKSCRLRWLNYLRPGIKRGKISPDERDLIIRLHGLLGNRWCLIAGRLPGRTDNEIKNYWYTHLSKGKKLHKIPESGNQDGQCEPRKVPLKSTAVKIREATKNVDGGSSGDHVEQSMKNSNTCSELMVDNIITVEYSNINELTVRTEGIDGKIDGTSKELMKLNKLVSPQCDIFFSPSDYPRDFIMEDILGMEDVESINKTSMPSFNMLLSEWEHDWEKEAALLF